MRIFSKTGLARGLGLNKSLSAWAGLDNTITDVKGSSSLSISLRDVACRVTWLVFGRGIGENATEWARSSVVSRIGLVLIVSSKVEGRGDEQATRTED
jgi:hypothetical protein